LPSRRPFSRPPVVAPVLPPVVALAPAMVVPPPFDRVQCPNLEFYGYCPTGALCMYDHGYQPDLVLREFLDIPRRRPQNPQQPPPPGQLANWCNALHANIAF
jgi:hypothetical protein